MSSLSIALVQTPLVWENPPANREMLSQKISTIQKEVDLIILPEMFTTGFTMNPSSIDEAEGQHTISWMRKLAKSRNSAIMGSIVYKEDEFFFNRLFFVEPNGKTTHYNKRHTFTYAGEHKQYQRGEEQVVLSYKSFKICPLICYDLRFPVWARNTFNYDLLVYVANWPEPRIAAWDALLKARAIENMAFCIGVNRLGGDPNGHKYPGHSATYDCLGTSLVYSEEEEVLYTQLSKSDLANTREKLQFLEDMDSFNL